MLPFHLFGRAAKSFIEINDSLFQKSLKRVVPNLDQLYEEPGKALDHNEVVIGPTG
jgi:hypothetical protein